MIIRKMELKDVEQVADIGISCWKKVYRGIIDDEYLDNIDRNLKIIKCIEKMKISNYIVAEYKGRVVGYCRYDDYKDDIEYDCEIIALYVNLDMLKQGIGREMFKYVVNEFKQKGKNKMILWCLKENYNSRKFYEKMGGKVVKEMEKEIGNKKYMVVAYGYNI